ncbi:Uncharacterized protein HZ326_23411 [Fusarium oxysporum f. sp. albedinis]|nr:Uncharacterized protein HZ326_23411 [Fusarium oxysporum f. sp. albedinis]
MWCFPKPVTQLASLNVTRNLRIKLKYIFRLPAHAYFLITQRPVQDLGPLLTNAINLLVFECLFDIIGLLLFNFLNTKVLCSPEIWKSLESGGQLSLVSLTMTPLRSGFIKHVPLARRTVGRR